MLIQNLFHPSLLQIAGNDFSIRLHDAKNPRLRIWWRQWLHCWIQRKWSIWSMQERIYKKNRKSCISFKTMCLICCDLQNLKQMFALSWNFVGHNKKTFSFKALHIPEFIPEHSWTLKIWTKNFEPKHLIIDLTETLFSGLN